MFNGTGNAIQIAGGEKIGEALKVNQALTKLDLASDCAQQKRQRAEF